MLAACVCLGASLAIATPASAACPVAEMQGTSDSAASATATRATAGLADSAVAGRTGSTDLVAYTSLVGSQYDVFAVDANGGEPFNLTNTANEGHDEAHDFSFDHSQVLLTSSQNRLDLYTVGVDGTCLTNVTANGVTVVENAPDFSPVENKIVYYGSRGDVFDIYTINLDRSGRANLTHDREFDRDPHFSPDGQRVVFVRAASDSSADIYTVGFDGLEEQRIFDGRSALEASFSPDGSRILFSEYDNTDREIYTIAADGGDLRQLTDNDSYDSSPRWSPDGSQVAFLSRPAGQLDDLAIMDADGSAPTKLTQTPEVSEQYPDFSPDGTRVAFNTGGPTEVDIYVIDVDGANKRNLTLTPEVLDYGPVW